MIYLFLFKEWQIEIFPQIPALTVSYGLPWWLSGKESACQCSRNPLRYSCLGNPMYRGAWQATVHGAPKSRTRLSN